MADVAQASDEYRPATTYVRTFSELSLDMLEAVAHESALVTHGEVKRNRDGSVRCHFVPRWSQTTSEAVGLSRHKPVQRVFADARWRALRRLLEWQGIPYEEGYADRCARAGKPYCLCEECRRVMRLGRQQLVFRFAR